MCCFSRNVKAVADTNIFARASEGVRQFLVYSMKVDAPMNLAMILPIPTPKNSDEKAVKFISLKEYDDFFAEMRTGFPAPKPGSRGPSKNGGDHGKTLEVVQVGNYIASFVPSVKDFKRLDEQFRLPDDVWAKLPQYEFYGFAAFQLKKGAQKVHPMAFEFPRANPKQLFFPTVHIHDGTVKPKAKFDHMLFCQPPTEEMLTDWEESRQPAEMFMKKHDKSQGIIDPKGHCYRKTMTGMLKNDDVLA